MMQSLYEEGISVMWEWWLPSAPDRKLPGALTFTQEDGGRLSVLGSFEPFPESLNSDRRGEYDRICGAGGGQRFTLEGCFVTSTKVQLGGQAPGEHSVIFANQVLRGVEFDAGERLEISGLDVRLLHMPYWGGGFFRERYRRGDEEDVAHRLEHQWADTTTTQLDDGRTLHMMELFSQAGDRQASRTWHRDWIVRIEGPVQPLSRFLETATLVQHLITIGAGRASTFESVQAHHPDLAHDRPGGGTYSTPFDVFVQWTSWKARKPERIDHHDMLFTLAEAGGVDALGRWCDRIKAHRKGLNRVISSRTRATFVEDRLFDRAAALEGFDRRRSGPSGQFLERIDRCIALAGSGFVAVIGDPDRWARALRTERDEVAHHFDDADPTDGSLVYWLGETAYYLLVLCLLRLADVDEAAITRVETSSSFTQAAERLVALW